MVLRWADMKFIGLLLVDFDLGAFAGQVGHADPEVGHSPPDPIVARLLEDRLHVHGEFDPVSGRFSFPDRRQHGCNNNNNNNNNNNIN